MLTKCLQMSLLSLKQKGFILSGVCTLITHTVAFVVRIISQLVQELNNRTFNDKASYHAVSSDTMLKDATGYMAGADLVSSSLAVNATLSGVSRMTCHTQRRSIHG